MTDDRAKLPNVELSPLGSTGDKLAPSVVEPERLDGWTAGNSEGAGVAEVNVERLTAYPKYYGPIPLRWITREEFEKMYGGHRKRYLS